MRLATVRDGTADGCLVVIAPDGEGCAQAPVATLQQALEQWDKVSAALAGITIFRRHWTRPNWPRLCRVHGNGSMARLLPAMAR
jgi:hypothetical protein